VARVLGLGGVFDPDGNKVELWQPPDPPETNTAVASAG